MTRSMIVTGGAVGIGRGIAKAASTNGYRVGLLDPDPAVEDTARDLEVEGHVGSVTEPDAVERVLDRFGTPDVWVNNAGIVRFGPLLEHDLEDWRAVVDVNLTGVFVGATAAARRMIERGSGVIVNVSSMNGVAPGPGSGAYGPTKAAVALLTQQMAIEWGRSGVRVNAVAPGLIDGGMSTSIYADPEIRKARTGSVPLGRLGTVDDIARAVLFLADERSSYVTGQNLLVDGGVTMAMIANLPRPTPVERRQENR